MSSLTFSYSSMNAGKSLALIKIFYDFAENINGEINSDNILCLTSPIDIRHGKGKISSRPLKASLEAITVEDDDDLLELYEFELEKRNKKIDVILVDEAQFFSEDHVLQLCYLVDKMNVTVMCFGLRTNFQGELFEGSQALLRYADKIREIKNKCTHIGCTKKATMNARIDENNKIVREGDEIEIGAEDSYRSVCRDHFLSGL